MPAGAKVLGARTPNRRVPSVVQSTKVGPSTTATVTLTLGSGVTAGNLLLAFVGYSQYPLPGSVRTVVTPAGWTKLFDFTGKCVTAGLPVNSSYDSWSAFLKPVAAGDGTTYAWTITTITTDENAAGILYEVTNVDTANPVNAMSYMVGSATSENSGPLANCYATLYGCLAICGFGADSTGDTSLRAGGWTQDQYANSGLNHQMQSCSLSPNPPAGTIVAAEHTIKSDFSASWIVALTPAPY